MEYPEGVQAIELNEQSRDFALEQIRNMDHDMGGTNILTPLEVCQKYGWPPRVKGERQKPYVGPPKRIFILTDGIDYSSDRIIRQAREHVKEDFRVFTFGLGSECDKYMITWAAKEGRGYSTIVHDG